MGNNDQKNICFISTGTIVRLFLILIALAILGALTPASAATWHVSTAGSETNGGTSWGDAFATIQRGINEAENGDSVLVDDGTYTGAGNKNIDFGSNEIEVRSVNGPDSCIIDLENEGKGFYLFLSPAASIVDGFTIRNGRPEDDLDYGVGIKCWFCSTTIRNCIIKNNSGVQWGAGIDIRGGAASPPVIVNCVFTGNQTKQGGSAVSIYQVAATFINCTFTGNSSFLSVIAGTISTSITNSIVWNNTPETIGGNVTYSNVEGGYAGDGNIDADPLFFNTPDLWDRTIAAGTATTIEVSDATRYAIDDVIEINDDGIFRAVTVASGTTVAFAPSLESASTAGMLIENWGTDTTDLNADFHLYSGSPCIDAGNNNTLSIAAHDIDGKPRFIDGDDDMDAIVDMGAYEYGQICEYDYLSDQDTDGSDLADHINDTGDEALSILSADFGRIDCPVYAYALNPQIP